jgi:Rrf2 family nitric oxide-sensitive transcriptional repressor
MFSQTAEYSLRTIVWLASQGNTPQTTQRIARATRVPPGYLSKILQTLGRAGLVRSQRGLHGGFTLAASPTEISPLDVINAIDPIRRIEQCPLGLESHSDQLCPLHSRLDAALAHIESVLAETRISELVDNALQGTPFCVK